MCCTNNDSATHFWIVLKSDIGYWCIITPRRLLIIVEFVGRCIMGVVIKAQNDRRYSRGLKLQCIAIATFSSCVSVSSVLSSVISDE